MLFGLSTQQRWLFPDATGKRGGRPKFKKVGEFPRVNCPKAGVHITGQTIKFSKIGEIPIILHRPLLEAFTPKTCTVVQRADGWYVCITLEDKTVPAPVPKDKADIKNATGIDLGLNSFLVTGLAPKVLSAVGEIQKQLSRKQKGFANSQKSRAKVSRLHLRIKRQRKDFHYKEAYQLCRTYDLIRVEDLNI